MNSDDAVHQKVLKIHGNLRRDVIYKEIRFDFIIKSFIEKVLVREHSGSVDE